jgi:hypothetical protein
VTTDGDFPITLRLHSDDIEHLRFLIEKGVDYTGLLQHILTQMEERYKDEGATRCHD